MKRMQQKRERPQYSQPSPQAKALAVDVAGKRISREAAIDSLIQLQKQGKVYLG